MENKVSWTIVENEVSDWLMKTEPNGQIKIVPFSEDNSDYQEYLASLEPNLPEVKETPETPEAE
jgi:hypothetical protein